MTRAARIVKDLPPARYEPKPGWYVLRFTEAPARNAANSSAGKKPHSAFGIPFCDDHHKEWHGGDKTFIRKYGIDPYKLAAWFLRIGQAM